MRNMQGTMRICWLFGLPSKQKLCTNQPHVLCPCSNLSAWRDPFSSKTLSVKSQATNGKKSHVLHLLLPVPKFSEFMNCVLKGTRKPSHNGPVQDCPLSNFGLLFGPLSPILGYPFAFFVDTGVNCLKEYLKGCFPYVTGIDTVCLSIIKTSKRSGISETCTTCMSLHGLTFHDPGPR